MNNVAIKLETKAKITYHSKPESAQNKNTVKRGGIMEGIRNLTGELTAEDTGFLGSVTTQLKDICSTLLYTGELICDAENSLSEEIYYRSVYKLRSLINHIDVPDSVSLKQIDIDNVLEMCVRAANEMLRQQGVFLTYACCGSCDTIIADYDVVIKAVAILIGNAVKQCEAQKKIGVVLRTTYERERQFMEISVAHSGATEDAAKSLYGAKFLTDAIEKAGGRFDIEVRNRFTWYIMRFPKNSNASERKPDITRPEEDIIFSAIKTELADIIDPSMFTRGFMDF